jgi:hypothetical protein
MSHIHYARDLRENQVKNNCIKFHAFLEYVNASRYVCFIPGNYSVVPIIELTACYPNMDVRIGEEKLDTTAEKRILTFFS